MRIRRCAAALLFLLVVMRSAHAADAGFQLNVDLPGDDLRGFDLPKARPALCREACANVQECRAWTFVQPGIHGPYATCWLKKAIPADRSSMCCISGVKP